MTAYYNEIDPYAAQWLRNLIEAGHIAPGDVDERSIADVRAGDLGGYAQCHFFAGIGGWSLALRLAGWDDDRPVWTGSCPCQPFSAAGQRKGFDDERHLWPFWLGLIRERHPAILFGEQVARATDWLGIVCRDLETLDYAVGAMPIEAASIGANHRRDRFWFVSYPHRSDLRDQSGRGCGQNGTYPPQPGNDGPVWPLANTDGSRRTPGERDLPRARHGHPVAPGCDAVGNAAGHSERRSRIAEANGESQVAPGRSGWWQAEPNVGRVVDGVPARVAKLRAFGNAIVPQVAAEFIAAAREAMN